MENETVVNYEELNFFQKVLGIFYKPKKTFQAIKRDESIALPIMIGCLAVVISGVITILLTGDDLMKETFDQLSLNYEDYKVMVCVVIAIGGAIGYFVMLLIESLEIFIISKIFGGEGTYTKYMAYMGYINILAAVGSIVGAVVALIVGSNEAGLSLALFAGDMEKTSMLYKLLSFVSVFGIWSLILKAKCIAVEEELEVKKEYTALAIIVVISLAMMVVLGI